MPFIPLIRNFIVFMCVYVSGLNVREGSTGSGNMGVGPRYLTEPASVFYLLNLYHPRL